MKSKTCIVVILIMTILLTACKSDIKDDTSADKTNGKNVSATPAPTIAPTATPVPLDPSYITYNFDPSVQYQKIDGFGAAYTWYSDWLAQCDDQEGAYDKLFKDAKMSILRFKNEYEYNSEDFASNAANMVRYYQAAKKRAEAYGEEPVVLMSCWSPPKKLKTNNDITGNASLRKDENGNFVYDEYGEWWAESIAYYEAQGIKIDYIAIQNEVDFAASYDGCRFDPVESADVASYAKAHIAVYNALKARFGDDAPKILGPETMSCLYTTINFYMKDVFEQAPESVAGLAHHLYVGGDNVINLMDLNTKFKDLKKWETEYYVGDGLKAANIVNETMTYEQANAYLYWSGTWNDESEKNEGYLMGIKLGKGNWITDTGWRLTPDYYAMRHFSEFVRPGYTRVKAVAKDLDVGTSAYISPDSSKVAIVLINNSDVEKKYQITGTSYTIKSSNVVQSIFADASENQDNFYKNLGSLGAANELVLPPKSVTSIDITGAQAAAGN